MAQTAPLFGMALVEGNHILAGGNFWGVLPYEGRYDADYGDMISTSKQRQFKWVSSVSSGFLLKGEVRDIKPIKTATGIIYAVAFNNKPLQFFKAIGNE